jgi:putative N6-adenine-specific DNA methylase
MVHKALATRLSAKYGTKQDVPRRPDGVSGGDVAEIRVYVEKDVAYILLDITGAPLYKRGYRLEGGGAPLRETTAAAMLILSGWKRKYSLYDPFCGSGTVAIEAALYAYNIAPGLARSFQIDNLLIANKEVENSVRAELKKQIDTSYDVRITGSDSDNGAVQIAKKNLSRVAELYGLPVDRNKALVRFNTVKMEDARSFDNDGFIITNPPYGKRMGDLATAQENYKNMSVLKTNFPSWKIVVISDNTDFETFYGSKADVKKEIISGGVLYIYEFQHKPSALPPPAAAAPTAVATATTVSSAELAADVKKTKKEKYVYTW